MWKELLENVRKRAPRIHCITNYVSMNDCANILLACGASPIMAMDEAETAQITSICDGLTINIGTLSRAAIPAMLASGKLANELGIPVVLDPVGTGASDFRTESAVRLLKDIRFTAIRGNASELRALYAACENVLEPCLFSVTCEDSSELQGLPEKRNESKGCSGTTYRTVGEGSASGVDVNELDRVTEENLAIWIAFVKDFARRVGAVVALTGTIDIVADENTAYVIRNGHPMMSRVTGTGCQLSVLTAAFLAANSESIAVSEPGYTKYTAAVNCTCLSEIEEEQIRQEDDSAENLSAVAASVCAMGVCGEIAHKRLSGVDGNATYRNYIIDAVYHLTPEQLETEARYEMR